MRKKTTTDSLDSARSGRGGGERAPAMAARVPGGGGAAAAAEAEVVPTFSSLEPIYGDGSPLDEARLRLARLADKFHAAYAARPALFARSPGRLIDGWVPL